MNHESYPGEDVSNLANMERQVERGQLFTYTALGEGLAKVGETSAFLFGLIDILLQKGLVTEKEIQSAVSNVHQQMAEHGELNGPGTMIRLEASAESEIQVNEVGCKARLPICKAVCCKLNFALTIKEIESALVKWDLGRPYFIRHEDDGYCSHYQRDIGGCSAYADRPGVCRHYSCANDDRIWKDFEKMELNAEWIAANLEQGDLNRRVGMLMMHSGKH